MAFATVVRDDEDVGRLESSVAGDGGVPTTRFDRVRGDLGLAPRVRSLVLVPGGGVEPRRGAGR